MCLFKAFCTLDLSASPSAVVFRLKIGFGASFTLCVSSASFNSCFFHCASAGIDHLASRHSGLCVCIQCVSDQTNCTYCMYCLYSIWLSLHAVWLYMDLCLLACECICVSHVDKNAFVAPHHSTSLRHWTDFDETDEAFRLVLFLGSYP